MINTMHTSGRYTEAHTPMSTRSRRNRHNARGKQVWSSFRALNQAVLALFQKNAQRISIDPKGNLLLETLVAITVFALVGGAVLSGTSTALNTGTTVEEQSVAEEIARNQMESVFNESYQQPLSTPYPTIVPPAGYAVSLAADEYVTGDVDIEMLVVTVSRDSKSILVLETLRTRWD